MKNRLFRIFTELARHHISVMLAITLFDLVLMSLGESVTICFSLLLPQRILGFGEIYALIADTIYTSVPAIRVYTYLMIAICFALFGIALGCSYRRPGWLICAAVMTFLDTAVAVWMLIENSDPTYYVDIAVHGWIVLALISGYVFERLRTRSPKAVEPEAEEAKALPPVEEATEAEEAAEVEEAPAEASPAEGYAETQEAAPVEEAAPAEEDAEAIIE